MPTTIACNLSALTVATLFYFWRAYRDGQSRREQQLRQRVAYMLWIMANSVC